MALTLSGGFAVQNGNPAVLSPARREKGKAGGGMLMQHARRS